MAKFTWISSRTFDANYQELLVQKFSREVTVKNQRQSVAMCKCR